ncbi:MAG: D-glycero-beta-D-manno-heptose-7-phosphate kinase [candidate division Zixibacteria bacterium]|nr:D-glycero-beta-D-manno-heptose-7-phosphate kinase [candidate division Zixibacteria bacterium]
MKVSKAEIRRLVSNVSGKKIMVLGDVMLDCYLWGEVSRISPEAPVPVVAVKRETYTLGGAGNVAKNLADLGAHPILVGARGEDENGKWLLRILKENKIDARGVKPEEGRNTTMKTRIVAHSQQVVRADLEDESEISEELQDKIIRFIKRNTKDVQGLIISDYGKGVISQKLITEIIDLMNRRGIFIAVDPKESNFMNYQRVSVITPNHHEAGIALRKKIVDEDSLHQVGFGLVDLLEARAVLITRGEKGMSLFQPDSKVTHIPTVARQVYDVTGAGDTVIATLVAMKSAGATIRKSAYIANLAAGIVVGEIGTSTITVDKMLHALKNGIRAGAGSAIPPKFKI